MNYLTIARDANEAEAIRSTIREMDSLHLYWTLNNDHEAAEIVMEKIQTMKGELKRTEDRIRHEANKP